MLRSTTAAVSRRALIAAVQPASRAGLAFLSTTPKSRDAWDLAGPSNSVSAPSSSRSSSTGKGQSIGGDSSSSFVEPTASVSDSSGSGPLPPAPTPQGNEGMGGLYDWSRSFHGLSAEPFSKEVADTLLAPIDPHDIEMKPDGLIYLPEIKYRRILNKSFGPGGWGLAPRGETNVGSKIISREYGLVCLGRLVSVARGEQEYFDPSGVPTATEGCKSNALMRCCKDLGIASELWDPRFIREFKAKHCVEAWGEHVVTKKKRKLWRRKDEKLAYPYEEKK